MFKAILDSPRPLKSGLVTVTMTCQKSDLHSIVDLMGSTVTVYGESEAPATDDRAATLARIRSLAEQVAEAIDRELSQVDENPDLTYATAQACQLEIIGKRLDAEMESGK